MHRPYNRRLFKRTCNVKKNFIKDGLQISVPAVELKREFPTQLTALAKDKIIMPNEFVLVESNNNPHNYRSFSLSWQ